MSSKDITRHIFEPKKNYRGVRHQQGRVILDDDLNSAYNLQAEDEHQSRAHIIGPYGYPSAIGGLAIDEDSVSHGDAASSDKIDFNIGSGVYYIGGHRLTLAEDTTFHTQPDWQTFPVDGTYPPPMLSQLFDQNGFIFLEAWEQPVSAVEDSSLYEPVLGGVDTTLRNRLMGRVLATLTENIEGWHNFTTSSFWRYGVYDPHTGENIKTSANLKLGFVSTDTADLCVAQNADQYLGPENQTIRIQVHEVVNAEAEKLLITWGFDNGAPLYQVHVQQTDDQFKVSFTGFPPRDQYHWPVAGQLVELLPVAAQLTQGDTTPGRGPANLTGLLCKVDVSYNPSAPGDFTVSAIEALQGYSLTNCYLRIWNQGWSTPHPYGFVPVTSGRPAPIGDTGLTMSFTGNQFQAGDFWVVSVRPGLEPSVFPKALLEGSGKPPDGPRRYYAPLAEVKWDEEGEPAVTDIRSPFETLTDHTSDCITYRVKPSDVDSDRLNTVIEKHGNGHLAIFFPNDTYEFSYQILIDRPDVSLRGCHQGAILKAKLPTSDLADGGIAAGDALIRVLNTHDISIENLTFQLPNHAGIELRNDYGTIGPPPSNPGEVERVLIQRNTFTMRGYSAIFATAPNDLPYHQQDIFVRDNVIFNEQLASDLNPSNLTGPGRHASILLAGEFIEITGNRIETRNESDNNTYLPIRTCWGGVHIAGASELVHIANNIIYGGNGHGISLGSVYYTTDGKRSSSGIRIPIGALQLKVENAGTDVFIDPLLPILPLPPLPNPYKPYSEGFLDDVVIEENKIVMCGGSGVSAGGFFPNAAYNQHSSGNDEEKLGEGFIHTRNLTIRDNLIRFVSLFNPRLAASTHKHIGQGGICLASASFSKIWGNSIEGLGTHTKAMVSGIFMARSESAIIISNTILQSAREFLGYEPPPSPGVADLPDGVMLPDIFGGIVIQLAVPSAELTDDLLGDLKLRLQYGIPAVYIAQNTVVSFGTSSLSVVGFGPMTITDNHFTRQGLPQVFFQDGLQMGTNTFVLNLGLSNELLGQWLAYALQFVMQQGSDSPKDNWPIWGEDAFKSIGLGFYNGNVQFSGNHCMLVPDLEKLNVLGFISNYLLSLDDADVTGNVFEYGSLFGSPFPTNTVALAGSLRFTDNRLKDGPLSALVNPGAFNFGPMSLPVWTSALTFGLMNITSMNQSTACIYADSLPASGGTLRGQLYNVANQNIVRGMLGRGSCAEGWMFRQEGASPSPGQATFTPQNDPDNTI